ncbi:MAG: oligosaccharide flippase family protein [Planctomycetota bacterium]|jgi:O-antigen/teichoic acid export membrane protein|nr:oligosaccharide flippase family protein [Planctomycetota bacterium]
MVIFAAWQQKIRDLFSHRFVRDVSVMQASNILVMGLAYVGSVLLVRHLGQDNYGLYSLSVGLFTFFRYFTDVGLDHSVLPKMTQAHVQNDRNRLAQLIGFYLSISFATATLLVTLGYGLAPFLAKRMYGNPDVAALTRIILSIAILEIGFRYCSTVIKSLRQFVPLSVVQIASQIGRFGLVATGVLLDFDPRGMAFVLITGTALSSVFAYIAYRRVASPVDHFPSMSQSLREIRQVPFRPLLISGFAVALGKNLGSFCDLFPILVLGTLSMNKVAHFKVVLAVVSLPCTLLSAISSNTTVKLSELYAQGDIDGFRNAFRKITWISLKISIGVTLLFALASPLLLWIYGPEYLSSLHVALIFLLHPLFAGLGIATTPFFRIVDRVGTINIIQACIAVVVLSAGYFLIRWQGVLGAAILLVVLRNLFRIIGYRTALWMIDRPDLWKSLPDNLKKPDRAPHSPSEEV